MKNKMKAEVSVRIYPNSRKSLKMLAARYQTTIAGMVAKLIEDF